MPLHYTPKSIESIPHNVANQTHIAYRGDKSDIVAIGQVRTACPTMRLSRIDARLGTDKS
jgi:hypothetical protein